MRALPSEVEVRVEVPRGARTKRRSDGSIRYVSPISCPFNYGCVPDHLAADGEPLDALVLGPPLGRGTRGRWAVHGVIRFVDAGVVDDKLVCGEDPPDPEDLLALDRFFRRYARIKALFGAARRAGPTRYLGWERR